jgi:catechol 2,3-dioxygenase-like lactoylglutathione lyase family enzyme
MLIFPSVPGRCQNPHPRTPVRPHISLITLGVDDLVRAVAFYRDGLGLSTSGIMGTEFDIGAVAFFDLQPGLKLAVWPRQSLAADTGLPLQSGSPTSFSLAHNVSSEAEVNEVMDQARHAGARIVKPAQTTFWGGYAGYFQDPDGHLWEVAFNPDMPIL